MKKLCVVGSTGSIGTQTLDVISEKGYSVYALAANSNIGLLEKQIRRFSPAVAVCVNERAADDLRRAVFDTKTQILCGQSGLIDCVKSDGYDTLVNGIVGMAGTLPTVEAVRHRKNVVIANKEAVVTAGEIISKTVRENGTTFISCDSEHSAIMQCLRSNGGKNVSRLILTASGGPFFGMSDNALESVTPKEALAHPNWSMGPKITVDSATMMNKGLEIIEAVRLFDVPHDKVDVIIHRESVVHSMVEFDDGSVISQMSVPDMRLPIQYALTYPEKLVSNVKKLDFAALGKLTFFEPDARSLRAMRIARNAVIEGGTASTVMNAANEVAVNKFLKGEIGFCDIVDFIEEVLCKTPVIHSPSLEDILSEDRKIRVTYGV